MFRIIWGIILIGSGVWFLGQNLGWTKIEIGEFFAAYWPLILIILGLSVLAESLKSAILRILIIVIVAAVFILPFVLTKPIKINQETVGSLGAVNFNIERY